MQRRVISTWVRSDWKYDLYFNYLCRCGVEYSSGLSLSTFAVGVFLGGSGNCVDFDGLVFLVETDEPTFNFIEDCGGWPGEGSLDIFLILG